MFSPFTNQTSQLKSNINSTSGCTDFSHPQFQLDSMLYSLCSSWVYLFLCGAVPLLLIVLTPTHAVSHNILSCVSVSISSISLSYYATHITSDSKLPMHYLFAYSFRFRFIMHTIYLPICQTPRLDISLLHTSHLHCPSSPITKH